MMLSGMKVVFFIDGDPPPRRDIRSQTLNVLSHWVKKVVKGNDSMNQVTF